MTSEETLSPFLTAVVAFDLDEVDRLVRLGERDHRAFLSDQGGALEEGEDYTNEILAEMSERGLAVETENHALFELYETLILAGHQVPDSTTRRCLIRVIAGADAPRHPRAQRLMKLCNEQDMLTWQGSEWAAQTVKIMDKKSSFMKVMVPTPTYNDLYADAIGQATSAGNLMLLEYLCTHTPPGVVGRHTPFVDFSLPTHKAAANGQLECLQYLLTLLREDQWKAACPSTTRYSPLICAAAAGGQEHVVNWLLDNGVDIDELSEDGRNALSVAADAQVGVPMAKLLLGRGINPNGGRTGPKALHLAVWRRTPGLVDMLLAGGVDPNYLDGSRSPLMLAGMIGEPDAVRSLLAYGANIDVQDEQGLTPVAWASRNQREAAFLELYGAGADMTIADQNGLTAFDHAQGSVKAFLDHKTINEISPLAGGAPRAPRF